MLGLKVWLDTPGFITFECGGDSRLVVSKSSANSTDTSTKVSWRVTDVGTVDGVADIGFAIVAWFTDPAGDSTAGVLRA